MRQALNRLYDIAAVLAAMFLVILFFTVLLTIASREFHWGLRGLDAYAGYFMAACGFLSLAHTFKRNEHIRVTLFLGMAKGRARFWIEVWALGASSVLVALFAAFSVRLVMQSIEFKDISTSMDATPLWIPQLAMALGTVIFAIAVIDEFFSHLKNPDRVNDSAEALRHE
ncbi:MAG: TRAP transporter small permease [Betaproteobacteria bacterium]